MPFQYGTSHINEQWPEFWAILFRAQGFECFDPLRTDLWAEPGVEWWYAQNALIFAREGSIAATLLPADSRAEGRGLSRIHPENLLANLLGLPRRYRLQAAQEEVADLRSLVEANRQQITMLPALAGPARAALAGPDEPGVFPATRLVVHHPEQEIASLSRSLSESGAFLEAANDAFRAEHASRTELEAALHTTRTALQALEDEHQRCRDLERRLQAQSAARMVAETKLADFRTEEQARQRASSGELREEWQAALADAARLQEEAAAARLALDAQMTLLWQEKVVLAQRAAQVQAQAEATDTLRRSRTWRLTRKVLRLTGRLPMDPPAPLLEQQGSVEIAPAKMAVLPTEAEAETEAQMPVEVMPPVSCPIKKFGVLQGQVQWWTLAAATTRLKRLEVFDAADYLHRNADVEAAGIDPYSHFIQSGALEGRGRVDPEDLARLMGGLMLFDNAVRALPPPAEPDAALLPGFIADVGPVSLYVSTYGNVFMNDLAQDLAGDLRSAGVTVQILDETADIDARAGVCVYIAPHEFFTLGRGHEWIREDVLFEGFVLNTEQIQTSWFNTGLPFTLMARGMLDLCAQTADLFARTDMASLHVLPGVRRPPLSLTQPDRNHPLFKILPAAAKADFDPAARFRARPIDMSFFGTSSPRRDLFFARNAALFAQFETFNYCRRPGRGPITLESEDGTLSRLAGHVSGHSKISLNIHREEFGYFEWHRMIRLGMSAGSLVVSDPCLPHPSFIANEHYLQESARHIPDLLEWLLTTEDGEREAERVRANANRLITETYDVTHTVTELLSFFARHRHRPGD